MSTIETIAPIFIIIALGAFVRQKGFVNAAFLEPANRLVYYLAIPAMIFRAISQSSLGDELNIPVILATLACVPVAFVVALGIGRSMGIAGRTRGTFVQCAFHGNLGYIGLAVIFYYLGDQGLIKGSIIAGLIMILQNFLGVVALQVMGASPSADNSVQQFVGRIFVNPVILSALLGIAYAVSGWPIPVVADRCLKILSGLALPMALLLIGASLSFSLVRRHLVSAMTSSGIKLVLLPMIGWLAYRYMGLTAEVFLPGLILLAAPPATLTYVFAKEMQGDEELAVATISIGTILSSLTYTLWLTFAAIG